MVTSRSSYSLPGGAITYTYVNGAQTPQERSVSTRRTEDGLNLATTSYDLTAYLGSESACGAKVTDPSGNESCHSFNVDGYETSTVNYQGRKSDNKILHSTTTDYLSTSNYFNVNPSAGVTALALPWQCKELWSWRAVIYCYILLPHPILSTYIRLSLRREESPLHI